MTDPEELHPQTREKYCDDHEMFKMKNALGRFVCPFCKKEEN